MNPMSRPVPENRAEHASRLWIGNSAAALAGETTIRGRLALVARRGTGRLESPSRRADTATRRVAFTGIGGHGNTRFKLQTNVPEGRKRFPINQPIRSRPEQDQGHLKRVRLSA